MGLTLLHNNKEKINSSFLHLFAEFPMNLESFKNRGLKGLFPYLGNFHGTFELFKKIKLRLSKGIMDWGWLISFLYTNQIEVLSAPNLG